MPITFLIFFDAIKDKSWKKKHRKAANMAFTLLFIAVIFFNAGLTFSFGPNKLLFYATLFIYISIFFCLAILLGLVYAYYKF